jgi:hypothetical protein
VQRGVREPVLRLHPTRDQGRYAAEVRLDPQRP